MTNEEAVSRLYSLIRQCGMFMPLDWVRKHDNDSELVEAFRMAICALQERKEQEKPKTQGDLIRAMDDFTIKAWYCKGRSCSKCEFASFDGCKFMEFMKQPAEETDHDER